MLRDTSTADEYDDDDGYNGSDKLFQPLSQDDSDWLDYKDCLFSVNI